MQAGFSLGVLAGLAGLAVAFAGFSALLAAGVLPSKAAADYWFSVAFFLFPAGLCGSFAPGRRAGSAESTRSQRSSRPRRALLPTEPACWSWLP
jgi:hypothetical protein